MVAFRGYRPAGSNRPAGNTRDSRTGRGDRRHLDLAGADGATGPQGTPGDCRPAGARQAPPDRLEPMERPEPRGGSGLQGLTGERGATGATGPQGPPGPPGSGGTASHLGRLNPVFGQVGSSTGGEVTVTTLAGLTSDSWVSFTGFLRILPGDFVVSSGMYPGAGVVCRLTDQLGTTAYATTQAAIPDSTPAARPCSRSR